MLHHISGRSSLSCTPHPARRHRCRHSLGCTGPVSPHTALLSPQCMLCLQHDMVHGYRHTARWGGGCHVQQRETLANLPMPGLHWCTECRDEQARLSNQLVPPCAAMLFEQCCLCASGARLSLRIRSKAVTAHQEQLVPPPGPMPSQHCCMSCHIERATQSGSRSRWCQNAQLQQCMRECAPAADAEVMAGGLMAAATGAWVSCVVTGGLMAALCGPVVSQYEVITSVAESMPVWVNCTVPMFPAAQRGLPCHIMPLPKGDTE